VGGRAVNLKQIAGLALEVDAQVGAGGLVVAAGHLVEHVTLNDTGPLKPSVLPGLQEV
jgi:hypothetical protein